MLEGWTRARVRVRVRGRIKKKSIVFLAKIKTLL